jgi:hypothetical protein
MAYIIPQKGEEGDTRRVQHNEDITNVLRYQLATFCLYKAME